MTIEFMLPLLSCRSSEENIGQPASVEAPGKEINCWKVVLYYVAEAFSKNTYVISFFFKCLVHNVFEMNFILF